jgi:hypothetical protein
MQREPSLLSEQWRHHIPTMLSKLVIKVSSFEPTSKDRRPRAKRLVKGTVSLAVSSTFFARAVFRFNVTFLRLTYSALAYLLQIWVLPEGPKALSPVLCKLRLVDLVNMLRRMLILHGAPSLEELHIKFVRSDHLWRPGRTGSSRWINNVGFAWSSTVKITILYSDAMNTFISYILWRTKKSAVIEISSKYSKKTCFHNGGRFYKMPNLHMNKVHEGTWFLSPTWRHWFSRR